MPSEFELIERFVRRFGRHAPGLVLGPGDDCAILRPPPGQDLLATVDALVEGVHFDLAWARAVEVGHKALAVSLSDLAAMGGSALGFLVAIELPPARVSLVDGLARGMARLAARPGAFLAGGNFSRAEKLALTVTALGACPKGKALTRSGARKGDLIFLSGAVGDAALGLLRLREGRRDALSRAQLAPVPRLRAGVLAREQGATAAIDLSDGLVQDLGHLCRASGVGARVDTARLPLSPAFLRAARERKDPLGLALTGGEDYALLFTAPPSRARRLAAVFAREKEPLALVGECTRAGLSIVAPDGRPLRLSRSGWDHFAL